MLTGQKCRRSSVTRIAIPAAATLLIAHGFIVWSGHHSSDLAAAPKPKSKASKSTNGATVTSPATQTAQAQAVTSPFTLGWGHSLLFTTPSGSPTDAQCNSVATDTSGNTAVAFYTLGGNGNLDPAGSPAGAFTNTATSSSYQGGYAKYDPAGNFQWVVPLNCSARSDARHVAIGPVSGDVYVCGDFHASANFTTLAGTMITVAGSGPIARVAIVARLDAASGKVVWMNAFTTGSAIGSACFSVVCDAAENVYVTGNVQANGTASLNSVYGTGNSGLPLVADNSANNAITMFLLKCDKNGNGAWLKMFPGLFYLSKIAVDGPGNLYFTSYFSGTHDFDPGPAVYNLTSKMIQDAYVEKLDTNGNFAWVRQFGSPPPKTKGKNSQTSNYDAGQQIAVDANGNVDFLLDGQYYPTVTYNQMTGNLWQLDTNGNPRWAITVDVSGGGLVPVPYLFCVDGANDIYNGLVNEYNAGGTLVVSAAPGGGGNVWTNATAADAAGNFVFAGGANDPSSTNVYGQANISPTSTPSYVQTWGGAGSGSLLIVRWNRQ
jgi:hypothetical protein